MNNLILGIGVIAFIVYAAVQISYIRSLKRTSEHVGAFLQTTELNLNSVLAELRETLEHLNRITGNMSAVSEDVRKISSRVASVEKTITDVCGYMIKGFGPAAEANVAGLKAGIAAGVKTLVKSFREERSNEHERRTWS